MPRGFPNSDGSPATQSTLEELTIQQLKDVVDTFALYGDSQKVIDGLHHKKFVDPKHSKWVIAKCKTLHDSARLLMRTEVVVTPAVIEDGEETSPAVMNTQPSSSINLRTQLKANFDFSDLTDAQIDYVVNKFVAYRKADGSATWTYYKNEIVK